MNKQEVIEEIKNMQGWTVLDKAIDFNSVMIPQTKVLDIVNQLDEPKKPVIPQFVADWYEDNKDGFEFNLYTLCLDYNNCEVDKKLSDWFCDKHNKPLETLVNMHQFGYEVKKEKLYTVEIPNPNGDGYSKTFLGKFKDGKVELCKWSGYTSIEFADNWKQEEYAQLTESKIKEDFDWAWQFAEEVEE